jgi:two-component system, OmpR family, phosphate regulon response regulator PhoB
MARILVVEDEPDLRQVLAYNLRDAGHDVVIASEGRKGLALALEQAPDLVLLDLMLPDISGLEVCRTLKAGERTRDIPVVMLTARGEEIDRVVGFELGADDYVVKPFSVRELLLRLRAVLRRGTVAAEDLVPVREQVHFGKLTIDVGAHRIWVDDVEVALTPLEFKLLCTLYERRNRVQSRGVLLDDVWGASQENMTRTIDTHVKRLREKLGPTVGTYVETVRGVGYRFVGRPPETEAGSSGAPEGTDRGEMS